MSFTDLWEQLAEGIGDDTRVDDIIKQMCDSGCSSDELLGLLSQAQSSLAGRRGYDEPSPPDSRCSKKYQATVEDGTDSEDCGGSRGSGRRSSGSRSSGSVLCSFDSDSEDGAYTRSGLDSRHSDHRHGRYKDDHDRYPFSSSSSPTSTIPTSPDSPSTSPKSVRFSDRGRPVIHQTSGSAEGNRESRRYSYTAPQNERSSRDNRDEDGGSRKDPRKLRVDVKWGKLFDHQGRTTDRLKQVVSSVAHLLVTKYPPTDSLVIPPAKLKTFYAKYPVDSETLPHHVMFTEDSKRAMTSLQSLYERLHCEYHLISPYNGPPTPCIPALTPRGFLKWLTLFIESYPQTEALRLSMLVSEVPLTVFTSSFSSPSGPPEKLPSKMSPSIFPSHGVEETRELVDGALRKWERDVNLSTSFSYDRSSGSFSRRGSVPRVTTSCLSDLRTYSELQNGLDGGQGTSSRRRSRAHDDIRSGQYTSSKRPSAGDSRASTKHGKKSSKSRAPSGYLSGSATYAEEVAGHDKRPKTGHRDSSDSDRYSDRNRAKERERSPDAFSPRQKSRHEPTRHSSPPLSRSSTARRSDDPTPSSRRSSLSSSSSRSLSPTKRPSTSSRHRSSDKSQRESSHRDRDHHHHHHHRRHSQSEDEDKVRKRRDKDDHHRHHKSSKRRDGTRDSERERETVKSNSGRRRVR